ncbi:MAG TPA: hypothetical protein VJT73_21110 [Polyangiaceae bacterium]|nr:hypothetical protein [Polyangiaceae bacterium]
MNRTSTKLDSDPLRIVAQLLAPYLRECLGVSSLPSSAEMDLADSPAGKRRAYAAARTGEIEGAKKRQRRWYATRAAHDSWIEEITTKPARAVSNDVPEPQSAPTSLDAMRERLSLRKVAG